MINPPQTGRPALKWGLIFGGALAILSLANNGIQYATGAYAQLGNPSAAQAHLGSNLLLGCVSFLLEGALYFLAGMLTARANGKVGSSAIAGLIAAAIGTIIGGGISIAFLSNQLLTPPPGSGIDPAQYASIIQTVLIISVIGGIIIGLGIGAGIASLGGLVGRGQYEAAHPLAAMPGSLYSPMYPVGAPIPYAPPTGYPPPNMQGAYPPLPGAYPPPAPSPNPPTSDTSQQPQPPQ